MPIPPSSHHALHGATVLVNPSASNALVGKADYRRELVGNQSARCIAAYVYTSCGVGESSSDVVFDGHAIIAENGGVLVESERFRREPQLVTTDVDVLRLVRERTMTGSFGQSVAEDARPYRTVAVEAPYLDLTPGKGRSLLRTIDPHPFVPSDPATRDARSEEVFQIQTAGLVRRLIHLEKMTGKRQVAIGISGGLDSTLALLVTVRAFDELGWDRQGIIAYTMPGFGTTRRTRSNAEKLCRAFGVTLRRVSIKRAVLRHLKDIGHEPDLRCVVCQNAQARMRTLILMDSGFVIGTGDLTEIALGWCTYNGDHMSMYNVNAGVPKTLVRHVVAWAAERNLFGPVVSKILRDIVATPISPELREVRPGEEMQKTEEEIGPLELHDFFLHAMIRHGFAPAKAYFHASIAFVGRYDDATIRRWLIEFYRRFCPAQFKRDAAPDGPKVGSVALSQRGDWRMPSDIEFTLWLAEAERIVVTA